MINQSDVRMINLDPAWIKDAELVAEDVKRKKVANGITTSRFDAEGDSHGWLGERVLAEYLTSRPEGSPGQVTWHNENGESFGTHDFTIASATVDVKTAAPRSHSPQEAIAKLSVWQYLYPVNQDPAGKDAIVLIYVWPDLLQAAIVGWIPGADVAALPQRTMSVPGANQRFPIPNYRIAPIAQHFAPIDELLAAMEARQQR